MLAPHPPTLIPAQLKSVEVGGGGGGSLRIKFTGEYLENSALPGCTFSSNFQILVKNFAYFRILNYALRH